MKVIKFPVLIFTLSKYLRACCGKTDTEISQEMLWNGSLKNWAFLLLSTRCIPKNKYSEIICTEISLHNKPQTCMILKSHNTYKEIGSIIKTRALDDQSWDLLSGFNFLSSSRSSRVLHPMEFNPNYVLFLRNKLQRTEQYRKTNDGTSRASQEVTPLVQSQNH